MNVRLQRSKSHDTSLRPTPLITPVPPTPTPISHPYIEHGRCYWHALLIGITYTEHEDTKVHLHQPHNEIRMIQDLLLSRGWLRENITVLSDERLPSDLSDAGIEGRTYTEPTRDNIINALRALIRPALEGEHAGTSHKFFFYYAGHGAQESSPTGQGKDMLNECIVPLRSKIIFSSERKGDMQPDSVRSDNGWISDTTLCEILCRPLPENCRLRAFFDMCHSGTPLDLNHNYTWKSVPIWRRLRFNLLEEDLAPHQRQRSSPLHRTMSAPRSPPFPATCLVNNSDGVVTVTSKRTFKGVRRLAKPILLHIRRPKQQFVSSFVPEALPSSVMTPLPVIQPLIDMQETNSNDPALLPLPRDNLSISGDLPLLNSPRPTNLTLDLRSIHSFDSDILLASPESPEGDIEVPHRATSLTLPPTQPFPYAARRRTSSAPSRYAPFSKKPIKADIVCLGASTDGQPASDARSLAMLLIQLYKKNGTKKDLKNYQLLLGITSAMRAPQIPQLSSSRDLSAEWDRLFLI